MRWVPYSLYTPATAGKVFVKYITANGTIKIKIKIKFPKPGVRFSLSTTDGGRDRFYPCLRT